MSREPLKVALLASFTLFGWISGYILGRQDNSTFFVSVAFLYLNAVRHMFISSSLPVFVSNGFSWFERHVLLSNKLITVLDFRALLMLGRILIQVASTVVGGRSLEVNSLCFTLLRVFRCEVPCLKDDGASVRVSGGCKQNLNSNFYLKTYDNLSYTWHHLQ